MNLTTVVVTKKKASSCRLFLPLLPISNNNKTLIECHGATVTAENPQTQFLKGTGFVISNHKQENQL